MKTHWSRRVFLAIGVGSVCAGGLLFLLSARHHTCRLREAIISVASCAAYPVIVFQGSCLTPLKRLLYERVSRRELHDQIAVLTDERDALRAEAIALHAAQQHTKFVDDVRSFQGRYDQSGACFARILERHLPDNREHYFLVNAGSWHGIKPDMIAVHHSTLLGRVTEVYPWYSKVCAVTDHSCKVSVRGAVSGVCAVHAGCNHEQEGQLAYVSHLTPMADGELLLSSGQGRVFPEGFGVGRVSEVESDGLYQRVVVSTLPELRNIEACALLSREKIECSRG